MWITEVRFLVRSIINDSVEPYQYEDSRINTLIIHAAKIMVNDLNWSYDIDLCNNIITPDPSEDDNFIILCAYKTSCMFAAAEVKSFSMGGIIVRDGPSSIDFSQAGIQAQKRYEDICEQYEQKKLEYLINSSSGKIISGPIANENLNIGDKYGCC